MIKAATSDITKGWIYDAHRGITPEEAQALCVRNTHWQVCRLSMKGIPTHKKLERLLEWYNGEYLSATGVELEVRIKQINNYLGALRRGGQLDDNNMIKKWI